MTQARDPRTVFSIEISVPTGKVGALLGTGGVNQQKMNSLLDVRLTVVSAEPTSKVRLYGGFSRLLRARAGILRLMDALDSAAIVSSDALLFKTEVRGSVPKALVKPLMGKGGSVVRQMQEETGAKIHYQLQADDDNIPYVVRGYVLQVEQAVERIENYVLLTTKGFSENRVELRVPLAKVGLVRGRQDANLRQVMHSARLDEYLV